jgi:hypothetical protein
MRESAKQLPEKSAFIRVNLRFSFFFLHVEQA